MDPGLATIDAGNQTEFQGKTVGAHGPGPPETSWIPAQISRGAHELSPPVKHGPPRWVPGGGQGGPPGRGGARRWTGVVGGTDASGAGGRVGTATTTTGVEEKKAARDCSHAKKIFRGQRRWAGEEDGRQSVCFSATRRPSSSKKFNQARKQAVKELNQTNNSRDDHPASQPVNYSNEKDQQR